MKKLITLFLALGFGISSWAYDFRFGELLYNIVSSEDKTVEVTYYAKPSTNVRNYTDLKDTLIIPEYVTYSGKEYHVIGIGEYALASTNVKYVTMPNSIISLGSYAFSWCGLREIILSENLETIGAYAFEHNATIHRLELPATINSIGANAFQGCNNISFILKSKTPPSLSYAQSSSYTHLYLYSGIYEGTICYIPCGTYDIYASSSWGKNNARFIEQATYNVSVISSNKISGQAEVTSRPDCESAIITAIPNEGCTFVKWSDGNTQATRYLELTEDISLTAYFAKEGYTIHVYQDCNTTIE